MKIYAKSIWVLSFITIISFIMVLLYEKCKIYDISLAIFGSALITLIISIIGYKNEKQKTLENFYNTICKRISYLSTYIHSWSTEDKCNFYINHFLKDFPSIGDAYANIYFFCDIKMKKRKYIYNRIYSKCRDMANYIDSYYYSFATYINKTGETKIAIEKHIKKLEDKLFEDNGNYIENDFCSNIMNELNGKYYKIIYGKEMSSDMNE